MHAVGDSILQLLLHHTVYTKEESDRPPDHAQLSHVAEEVAKVMTNKVRRICINEDLYRYIVYRC